MNELKPCVAMRENQRLLTLAVTTAATAQPTRPSSSDLGMVKVEPDVSLLNETVGCVVPSESQIPTIMGQEGSSNASWACHWQHLFGNNNYPPSLLV